MSMDSFLCQPGCIFPEMVIFFRQCLSNFATSCSFTQLMNLALSGLTWTHYHVYLDDIIIWGYEPQV